MKIGSDEHYIYLQNKIHSLSIQGIHQRNNEHILIGTPVLLDKTQVMKLVEELSYWVMYNSLRKEKTEFEMAMDEFEKSQSGNSVEHLISTLCKLLKVTCVKLIELEDRMNHYDN